jgi:hypothetical protein
MHIRILFRFIEHLTNKCNIIFPCTIMVKLHYFNLSIIISNQKQVEPNGGDPCFHPYRMFMLIFHTFK